MAVQQVVGLVGRVVAFQRYSGVVRSDRVLLWFPGVESVADAAKLLNKKVVWKGKNVEIRGVIRRIHGKNGIVIAYFKKPLPGQALGTEVRIIG